jgi:hypothetical protein
MYRVKCATTNVICLWLAEKSNDQLLKGIRHDRKQLIIQRRVGGELVRAYDKYVFFPEMMHSIYSFLLFQLLPLRA